MKTKLATQTVTKFLLLHFIYLCSYECLGVGTCVQGVCESQWTAFGSQISASVVWVLRMERKSSGLEQVPLPAQPSQQPSGSLFKIRHANTMQTKQASLLFPKQCCVFLSLFITEKRERMMTKP